MSFQQFFYENGGMGEYGHSAHARDLIRQICQTREVVIVRGSVSPDHIHMLLSAPPHLAPALSRDTFTRL